jgi:cold shock CspA family protein
MAAAEGIITGTVNWFSVTKGYGACLRAAAVVSEVQNTRLCCTPLGL